MRRCFIFAAGTYYGLREKPEAGDLVLAADAGYQICRRENIVPICCWGDFDSMDQPADFDHVHPPDPGGKGRHGHHAGGQDRPGAGLRGPFYLYGGTGGKRLDHTLANLQTLLYLRRRGARGYLYDDDFVWTAIENETLHRGADGGVGPAVRVLPGGPRLRPSTSAGVQYPARQGRSLTAEFPLGVSNHILEPRARITVRDGALLVGWELPPASDISSIE